MYIWEGRWGKSIQAGRGLPDGPCRTHAAYGRGGGVMGTLTHLQKFKEDKTPHQSGEARCMACQHEWVAVSPVGTTWLECPECHTMKGLYKHACLKMADNNKDYEPWWTCKCGNELFVVYHEGIMCPNCGEFQYPK